MTEVAQQVVTGEAVRAFRVNAPEATLAEMRRCVSTTIWPDRETVNDTSQGGAACPDSRFSRLLGDRLDIHFIHVRSKRANALPLIVTHGWPGSIIEQLKIIEPLTDPTAHCGGASDAFHVVIPSIPGYGFSEKPRVTGWDTARTARYKIYEAPKSWAERSFYKLIYFNIAAAGGHFAAWEQPEMFSQELRAGFRPLRPRPLD